MTILKNWSMDSIKSKNHLHLFGVVENHPKLPSGSFIRTTRIQYAIYNPEDRFLIVGTRNTEYKLPFSECDISYAEENKRAFRMLGFPEGLFEEIENS